MKTRRILFQFVAAFQLLCFSVNCLASITSSKELVDFVDPGIGVKDQDSNCVIGPQLPFGSVNPSPDTPDGGEDGYNPAKPIRGFSQLHVSGTGWGKYGQVLVSPQLGLKVDEKDHESPFSGEIARANYYSATLTRYGIKVELAPTHHAVMYKFTFPASDESHISIDVSHNIPSDIATYIHGNITEGQVSINDRRDAISGWGTYNGGFAPGDYKVHFYAKFSRRAVRQGTWKNDQISTGSSSDSISTPNDRIGGFFQYSTKAGDPIYMKIGVSVKSLEQARLFVDEEIPDWDLDRVKAKGAAIWNEALGRIMIEGASEDQMKIFYTALYHTMIMPRDRSGDNPKWESREPYWDDHYAGWDTWRTLYPLMNLINQEMVRGSIKSFVDRLKHNGLVKDAFAAGNDMAAQQGGDEVDNIIAGAYLNGVEGLDWEEAYKVLKHNAENERKGFVGWYEGITDPGVDSPPLTLPQGIYRTVGWIPAGTMSCSYTLEFAYNDYCVAEVAKGLGKKSDYEKYFQRSKKWEALWNPGLVSDGFRGFIGPKTSEGKWVSFDAKKRYKSWKEFFYEGSSWTYSYFVPHDIPRLIELMGGKTEFTDRLEHALKNGLIEFANEPSFLALRTFNYARRPDLCSYWVRETMKQFTVKGYPGNEDSGAMGSWYVFSALGFFPNAGQDIYLLNGPTYRRATLSLGNGKKLLIEAKNTSERNIYIQSAKLNGRNLTAPWFKYADIKRGAVLSFQMGSRPSKWGQSENE